MNHCALVFKYKMHLDVQNTPDIRSSRKAEKSEAKKEATRRENSECRSLPSVYGGT